MKPLAAIDALAAWISRTPSAAEAESKEQARQEAMGKAQADLARCTDDPEFIHACAMLGQIGMSAEDLKRIIHAMMHYRILAFGFGEVLDLGQRGDPYSGKSSRSTGPYEEGDL